MRQILIKINKDVKSLAGNSFEFCANKGLHNLVFAPDKINTMKFPFKIQVMSGGRIDLTFTTPKGLAEAGIMLLGAYLEESEVVASFMNLMDEEVSVEDGYPVLKGLLVEIVNYRQISEGLVNTEVKIVSDGKSLTVVAPEKPKKGKKKKG